MPSDGGGGAMAELPKGASAAGGWPKGARDPAPRMHSEASPAPTPADVAAAGSQSPAPSARASGPVLRHGMPAGFSRSLNRSAGRRSGNWPGGTDSVRLSLGWSSTRRKGLKELLMQSSQVKSTWLPPSPRERVSVSGRQDADGLPDPNAEDPSFVLDPLEHEWMLTVAQGDAQSILRLLAKDPSLLSRRDFVTGFTALHWLAKHGHHEALIEVVAFAEERGLCPVDVDVPTAGGRFTPLHLAALQGHQMVAKVLVGAYGADTGLRDHNGRKAWQCLPLGAPRELKELLGAGEEDLAGPGGGNANNNCAPSARGTRPAAKGPADGAVAGPQSQRAVPGLSYFRNVFRQAVAFFQDW